MTEPLIVYVFVWTLVAIAILMLILDVYIILMWKKLIQLKKEDKELDENNIVEFVWEDENWNWLYRFK